VTLLSVSLQTLGLVLGAVGLSMMSRGGGCHWSERGARPCWSSWGLCFRSWRPVSRV